MRYQVYVLVFSGILHNTVPQAERLKAAECDDEQGALQLANAYVGRPFELPASTCFKGRHVGFVIAASVMPKEDKQR